MALMPSKDHYALSLDELTDKLNSARSAQKARYKGVFEPIVQVARRVFAKKPQSMQPVEVDADMVRNVASSLEATLVMAEESSPEAELSLFVRNIELAHFVAYMCGLDAMARELAERNQALTERCEVLNARRNHLTETTHRLAYGEAKNSAAFKVPSGAAGPTTM